MPSLEYPQTTKWVVAHNGSDVYHTSVVEPQNCFASGQPFMEVFDSKEELLLVFPHLSGQFIVSQLQSPQFPELPVLLAEVV